MIAFHPVSDISSFMSETLSEWPLPPILLWTTYHDHLGVLYGGFLTSFSLLLLSSHLQILPASSSLSPLPSSKTASTFLAFVTAAPPPFGTSLLSQSVWAAITKHLTWCYKKQMFISYSPEAGSPCMTRVPVWSGKGCLTSCRFLALSS